MKPIRYIHENNIKLIRGCLASYDADQDATFRKKVSVCRFCHYMMPTKITNTIRAGKCQACGKQVLFLQGVPELYCTKCASKQHICSRCGDDMD